MCEAMRAAAAGHARRGDRDGELLALAYEALALSGSYRMPQAELLLAAVQALPDDQREAFLLQAEGHMSVQDIAAATGVPFETAKSRLRYARAALRRALENL